MDRIDLPWLPADAMAGEAVGRLIEANRATNAAAIVTERGGVPVVIEAAALIAAARANAKAPLETVPFLAEGVMLPPTTRFAMETDLEGFAPALNARNAPFGVVRLFGTTVHVVTRHETIAASYRADLDICRCTGPEGHIWAAGELDTPGICNADNAPVICT
ncbi:MAG TPA: hypothetical protein VK403_09725 [Allosphingosinicella sp.]|nr:hypothetical protein [Allosphingosinicella sp.]